MKKNGLGSKNLWITLGGFAIGVLAVLLTKLGNPPNMGICVACFYRDITGAIGLHRAAVVQYLRPEIIGMMIGALLTAIAFREFLPRGGSSAIIRFLLGAFMMIGALVFLGCPLRAVLRLAGGDLNGITAIIGIIAGANIGIFFLKGGYNLGRTRKEAADASWMFPMIFFFLLFLILEKPRFLLFSEKGPGAMHAAVWISLLVGLFFGFVAQRTRMCFVGGWRDLFLVKDAYLFRGIAGFFVGVLLTNLILGNFGSAGPYHWGFTQQPIAHDQHLWNFLGMVLVGLTATLLGGCPIRQTVLAAEGDTDAGMTVLGLFAGAAASHNFILASSPKGPAIFGPVAVIIGLIFCFYIGLRMRKN